MPSHQQLIEWIKIHSDELKDMMEDAVAPESTGWHLCEALRLIMINTAKTLETMEKYP